ncbi:MAG: polymer-forming cytoskeletal protein [Saprospiraceae bacterium]|nr:polymer-forming cytoskeletal protein [Saprospiraceae bacterium]
MAKSTEVPTLEFNKIVSGTVIKGDIKSNGDIRIDGSLIGTLHSKAKVVLGPTGSIDGEITCKNADIQGTVKAQITVAELLTLKATAKVTGDIITNKIAIEPGAKFSGACKMEDGGSYTAPKPEIKHEAEKFKKETAS